LDPTPELFSASDVQFVVVFVPFVLEFDEFDTTQTDDVELEDELVELDTGATELETGATELETELDTPDALEAFEDITELDDVEELFCEGVTDDDEDLTLLEDYPDELFDYAVEELLA